MLFPQGLQSLFGRSSSLSSSSSSLSFHISPISLPSPSCSSERLADVTNSGKHFVRPSKSATKVGRPAILAPAGVGPTHGEGGVMFGVGWYGCVS
mmetsp:Transcript_7626/g.24424  ORF Transcript_7626/g.24424 Transcript_7626/m.24424 type:complete len:95 (+) Transcript_7626:923-1207(+)